MIIPIDRLQIIDGKLIVYEFINTDDLFFTKEISDIIFLQNKVHYLKNKFKETFCLILYSEVNNNYIVDYENRIKHYSKEQFKKWFTEMNYLSNKNNSFSKRLGTATSNFGDPFIKRILSELYDKTIYKNVSFSIDDNGTQLVQNTLSNIPTYGFDFDLFEASKNIIIEFLKRDNNYVTNKTAHPNRYSGNYNKFLNLWKAANLINTNSKPYLFLVNYSDNPDEAISLINVIEFNENCNSSSIMITHDIGYLFNNYSDFLSWLSKLNISPTEALKQLDEKPTEIRDKDFWKYFDSSENMKNEIKKRIGKNYKN
ncbi:hypothetical protein O3777_02630 [Gemella sanguinis]|uniref:hypothetical protein n=1 Tax=Gemella sanguinis TaxID=84135 RepID=UPI00352DDFB8